MKNICAKIKIYTYAAPAQRIVALLFCGGRGGSARKRTGGVRTHPGHVKRGLIRRTETDFTEKGSNLDEYGY